jgi:hypothetical protein
VTHPGVEVALLAWLADWNGHWPLLDRLAVMLADNDLFEATPFVTVLVAFSARSSRACWPPPWP